MTGIAMQSEPSREFDSMPKRSSSSMSNPRASRILAWRSLIMAFKPSPSAVPAMKQQSLAGEFDRERPGAPVLAAQELAFWAGRGLVAAELGAQSGNNDKPLAQ